MALTKTSVSLDEQQEEQFQEQMREKKRRLPHLTMIEEQAQ